MEEEFSFKINSDNQATAEGFGFSRYGSLRSDGFKTDTDAAISLPVQHAANNITGPGLYFISESGKECWYMVHAFVNSGNKLWVEVFGQEDCYAASDLNGNDIIGPFTTADLLAKCQTQE